MDEFFYSGFDLRLRVVSEQPPRLAYIGIGNRHVSRLRGLGWAPQGTLEGNIDEYLAWAQAQPDFRNYADEARAHMKRVGTVRGQ